MFTDIMGAKWGLYYAGGAVLWFDYFLTTILLWGSWLLLSGLLNIRSWKIINSEDKRTHGRSRHGWNDNIESDGELLVHCDFSISGACGWLVDSQERFCSMYLVV